MAEQERRYCEGCGHDITAWRKSAKTCGSACATGRVSHRAHGAFASARKRGARVDPGFTVKQLAKMIAARGNCYLCDTPLTSEYHIDHILPIIRGGKHEAANIGFLCPTCNEHKGDRTVAEYLEYVVKHDSLRIQRILDRRPLILATVASDDSHELT